LLVFEKGDDDDNDDKNNIEGSDLSAISFEEK
jgi:hypothetical protein